ncbi:transcriptional regulator [Bacteroidia bacterium]|nr:transcriptional regulator [Bacteroidia bacterium]
MKERLNQLMREKGLTATKLAATINANPSAISHFLSGRNKPGYDILYNLSDKFPDINMNWLINGGGNMYNTSAANTSHPSGNITQLDLFSKAEERSTQPVQKGMERLNNGESNDGNNGNNGENKENAARLANTTIENTTTSISNAPNVIPLTTKSKRALLFFDDGTFEEFTPRNLA